LTNPSESESVSASCISFGGGKDTYVERKASGREGFGESKTCGLALGLCRVEVEEVQEVEDKDSESDV
jgi:hypothetical protein